jgi:N-acetylneuraminic acid mutarotase
VAAMEGLLFAIGGRRDGSDARNLAVNEAYDPTNDRWEERASMPTARSGIAAAALNGQIFVFGGEAPSETFSNVEAYDPGTNEWSVYARMPTARHGLGAVVVGRSIYVIAGGPMPGASESAVNEAFSLD